MKEKIRNFILTDLLSNKRNFTLATDDDILSDGLLDSIAVVQLITFIEETFDLIIPPEDMVIENFISVDTIEGYIKNNKK